MGLSIRKIMIAAYVMAAVPLIALIVVNGALLNRADSHFDHAGTMTRAVLALKEARFHVVQIQQFVTDVGATRDDSALAEAEASRDSAQEALARLRETRPEYTERVRELLEAVEQLHRVGTEMARAYIRNGTDAGNRIMRAPETGLDAASAALADKLSTLADEIESGQVEMSAGAGKALDHANATVLWLGLAVLAMVLGIMLLLYRQIVPPLSALEATMLDIAGGSRDLTVRLDVEGYREIRNVAAGFNAFVENIRSLVSKVAESSVRLAGAGDQVSRASAQTLDGMHRLENETDQVARAVASMNDSVQEVSDNANHAAEAARESDEEARRSREIVHQTVASIEKLAASVEHAGEVIHRLEADTDNIGSILDVIRAIAEQTNLLALNAAIEAARAGEQGRGFAVVADEVRTLAQRTQEATQKIQSMIEQLQCGATDAVTAMDQGRSEAEASVRQAAVASEALDNITRAVETITQMNGKIAAAAGDQARMADDINHNIQNISAEAEQTVAAALTTESNSEEMGNHLKELGNLVREFQIGDGAKADR